MVYDGISTGAKMYDNLTTQSRQVVQQLADGHNVMIGGEMAGPMDPEQRRALSLLATALDELEEKSGATLAKAFVQQLKDHELPEPADPTGTAADAPAPIFWRLGKVRAFSFRGLAPAAQLWEHDFEGRSHLLYGPNGCGKSSLLGAIAWCLSGLVFRDDCPPSAAEAITVYTDADEPKAAGTRPDALSLTDGEGQTTDADEEYWVEVELLSNLEADDGDRLWLRRHSKDGLSNSVDGTSWIQGTSLEPVALDGQTALIRKCDDLSSIKQGTLACVDIAGEGAVIKRCYPSDDEWLLCTINVNEPQEPMRIDPSTILHVYPLIGILFEVVTEEAPETT